MRPLSSPSFRIPPRTPQFDNPANYLPAPTVNVGLLTYASYALYTQPRLRHDTRLLSSAAAGALLLFGAEGYAAERYRETPAGREEERRARKEGAVLYRHAREAVLRPGVLGGLLGFCECRVT